MLQPKLTTFFRAPIFGALATLTLAGALLANPLFVFGEEAIADSPPDAPIPQMVTGESIARGTGTTFTITNSKYLNISLTSSEPITAHLESITEMVILETNELPDAHNTSLIFSGFLPDTKYYLYIDGYEHGSSFTTDAQGAYAIELNLTEPRIVFIQPRHSTTFIRDDETGGDCLKLNIGTWDHDAKTCTLTTDIIGSVQISNDNVILDGAEHTVYGQNMGAGVLISNLTNTGITHLTVQGFSIGILMGRSIAGSISHVVSTKNQHGINVNQGNSNILENNIVESNTHGVTLRGTTKSILRDNALNNNTFNLDVNPQDDHALVHTIGSDNTINGKPMLYLYGVQNKIYDAENQAGIFYCIFCKDVTLKNATISNNAYSIVLWKSTGVQLQNVVVTDSSYGVEVYYSDNNTFTNFTADNNFFGNVIFNHSSDNEIRNAVLKRSYTAIQFNSGSDGNTMSHSKIIDNRHGVVLYNATDNIFTGNIFANQVGLFLSSTQQGNSFMQNDFSNTVQILPISYSLYYANIFSSTSPSIGGNHWSDYDESAEGCVDMNNDLQCDHARELIGGVDAYPWVSADALPVPKDGHSSVAFFPGLQASRLYTMQGDENTLWEPNRNADAEKLFMDEHGKSIAADIYTREVIDEAYGGLNIYKNFIAFMDKLVDDGVINEWQTFPYDWRMDYADILQDGVVMGEDGATTTVEVLAEVEKLAANSPTGKVTLIAHSNGGLLAKAALRGLEAQGKEGLVDKLILVATPQLGTPKAVASLLHGDGQELPAHIGILLNAGTAREMGENMQSAYTLAPSPEYFKVIDTAAQPMVVFDPSVSYIANFVVEYGTGIETHDELYDFMRARDGRTEPDRDDTDTPNVLGADFLDRAVSVHADLDAWTPPGGVAVTQIAGWGLDTVRGIAYSAKPWDNDLSNLDRKLLMTSDGDQTVVSPSATYMDVETYYVNLKENNRFGSLNVNRHHASILEIESLEDFIRMIINNNEDNNDLPMYISTIKPEDLNTRLRLAIHSPISINVIDGYGNHTGLATNPDPTSDLQRFEEQIPNSYYLQLGEHKYVGLDTRDTYTIVLKGEDIGLFTFEVQEVLNDEAIATVSFVNVPVMPNSISTLSLQGVADLSELLLDVDGDGIVDFAIGADDAQQTETSLKILRMVVASLGLQPGIERSIIAKIDAAQQALENEDTEATLGILGALINAWEAQANKHIVIEDVEKLISIVRQLQQQLLYSNT